MFFVFITQQLNCPSNTPLTVILTLKKCLIMQSFYCISKAVNDKKRTEFLVRLKPPTLHLCISALDHSAILHLISQGPNLRSLYYILHEEYEFTKKNLEILIFSVHFILVIYTAFTSYFSRFL